MKGLTQIAYAKRRGVSAPYLHRLYHGDRLVLHPDGSIDADASDAALAASLDPTHGGKHGGGALARAASEEAAGDWELSSEHRADARSNLTKSKEIEADFSAKLKKLAYEREVKTLVERGRVENSAADCMTIIDRGFRQIVDGLASRLAAETDARKVATILASEFETIRTALADAIASLPETLTAARH